MLCNEVSAFKVFFGENEWGLHCNQLCGNMVSCSRSCCIPLCSCDSCAVHSMEFFPILVMCQQGAPLLWYFWDILGLFDIFIYKNLWMLHIVMIVDVFCTFWGMYAYVFYIHHQMVAVLVIFFYTMGYHVMGVGLIAACNVWNWRLDCHLQCGSNSFGVQGLYDSAGTVLEWLSVRDLGLSPWFHLESCFPWPVPTRIDGTLH